MPLVTMRQLLDEAAAGGYGVGAFNVTNMEQIQGIMEAARAVQLGTAGHASDYAPLSLAQMRDRYADAAASGQTVTTGAAT